MLEQLTQYLLQFGSVTVPTVGTVRLIQKPATLDVAYKTIQPPRYIARFNLEDNVSDHQLLYFKTFYNAHATSYLNDLGQDIKNRIWNGGYIWTGIGEFEQTNNEIQFHPETLETGLTAVTAERVLRDNAQHSVLRGDNIVMSHNNDMPEEEVVRKKSYVALIAWIAALLALLFIVFYLYQHNFNLQGTGLQQKVNTEAPAPTHK